MLLLLLLLRLLLLLFKGKQEEDEDEGRVTYARYHHETKLHTPCTVQYSISMCVWPLALFFSVHKQTFNPFPHSIWQILRCETEEEKKGDNDVFLGIALRPSKYLIDWVTLKGSPVSGCPTTIICPAPLSLPKIPNNNNNTRRRRRIRHTRFVFGAFIITHTVQFLLRCEFIQPSLWVYIQFKRIWLFSFLVFNVFFFYFIFSRVSSGGASSKRSSTVRAPRISSAPFCASIAIVASTADSRNASLLEWAEMVSFLFNHSIYKTVGHH